MNMRGIHDRKHLQSSGLNKKLLTRAGALLARKIALSELFIGYLAEDENGRLAKWFLDPKLLRRAASADQKLIDDLLAKHDPEAENLPPLQLVPEAGNTSFRVLCLEEELLAGDEWLEGKEPADSAGGEKSEPADVKAAGKKKKKKRKKKKSTRDKAAMIKADAPSEISAPENYAGVEARMRDIQREYDAQRMVLFTSAETKKRIEALRKIAYIDLEKRKKAETFLHGLGDESRDVRTEAAKLLVTLGFNEDISQALVELNHDDAAERENALLRLEVLLKGRSDLEVGAVALAVLTRLREEDVSALRRKLIEVLASFGRPLAREEKRIRDVMRMLISLFANHPDEIWHPAYELVSVFIEENPSLMKRLLWEELEKTVRRDVEAFLLYRLAELVRDDADARGKLAEKCAYYIATDKEEGRDSRLVGTILTTMGLDGVNAIREAFKYSGDEPRKFMMRILDEMVRFRNPPPDAARIAAELVLDSLEVGKRGLRIAAMETTIAMSPLCPPELAGGLAKAYLEHINDFSFLPDVENAERIVAHIGLPAIEHLLAEIGSGAPAGQQGRAVRILGEAGRLLKVSASGKKSMEAREILDEILRKLQQISIESGLEEMGEVYVAMGKVGASPAMTREVINIIANHLMARAEDKENKFRHRAMEGLSWLCTSRKIRRAMIDKTKELLKSVLEADKPDLESETVIEDDEIIFTFNSAVDIYTENIPVAVEGLVRVALASNAGDRIPREITKYLVEWWRKLVRGKEVWGPSNLTRVADGLRDLGKWEKTSPTLRAEILKAMAARIRQMSVLMGITEVLRADDSPISAPIALVVIKEVLSWRDNKGAFDDEDREYIIRALGNLLNRREWKGEKRFPGMREEALEEMFRGLQDDIPGAYDVLLNLQMSKVLPEELQKTLTDRLTRYGGIIKI